MRKILFLLFFAAFVSENTSAQDLCVHEKEEAKHCLLLETVQSLVFSGDNVSIRKTDNTSTNFLIDKVRKITLNSETGTSNESIASVENEIEVSPNPVVDILTVKSPSKVECIYLFDMNGRLVQKETFSVEQPTIHLSALSPGMYNLDVITATGNYKKKIIKK